MSLLSSIVIPKLEEELIKQEPAIQQFIISQIHELALAVIPWAQSKLQPKEQPHEA